MVSTAELRDRIFAQFDRRLHATDDLGWDPNGNSPIDDSLSDNMRAGTLIEVPPGTYLVEKRHSAQDLKRWGIRGLGESHRDVKFQRPAGEVGRVFNIRDDSDAILIENLSFDQRDTWEGSLGNVLQVQDGEALVKDVEMLGKNPSEHTGATASLNVWPLGIDGLIVLDGFVQKGPTELVEYPDNPLCVFSGGESAGILTVRNSHFENCGEHGIYASRMAGGCRIENSYFKNNQNTQARVGGDQSWVKDSVFVWDDGHPNDGEFQARTGMTYEAGYTGRSGGLVEGCRFVALTDAACSGMLKIDGSQGAVTFRDCQLVSESNVPPLNCEAPGSSHMLDGEPDEPWDVTMENVHVTHRGSSRHDHDYAVRIQRRAGTTLTDVCIDATEADSDVLALRVEDGEVEVAGDSSIAGSIGGSNLVSGSWSQTASCIVPNDSWDPNDTTDPVIGMEHEILVRAPPDDVTEYRFTTSDQIGLITTGDDAAAPENDAGVGEAVVQNDDGTYTATGIAARGGGDTFEFDGELLAWETTSGPDPTVSVDGSEIDLSAYPTSHEPESEPVTLDDFTDDELIAELRDRGVQVTLADYTQSELATELVDRGASRETDVLVLPSTETDGGYGLVSLGDGRGYGR